MDHWGAYSWLVGHDKLERKEEVALVFKVPFKTWGHVGWSLSVSAVGVLGFIQTHIPFKAPPWSLWILPSGYRAFEKARIEGLIPPEAFQA